MSATSDLGTVQVGEAMADSRPWLRRALMPLVPVARVALLAKAMYVFVLIDLLYLHADGQYHAYADPRWYQPLLIGQLLHLPAASVPLVQGVKWVCLAAAVIALTGRFPRLAGWTVALTWAWFQYISFSYGKVDHDRADFVVGLFMLPTVIGLSVRNSRLSEAAGFALRSVQILAISTYFLSAFAKFRFGGLGWVNSATMARAVVRRGTEFGHLFLEIPWSLHALQWVLLSAELLSPLIFLASPRVRVWIVMAWYAFHAMVYATIEIAFWPHLVMMLAFLPLERYWASLKTRFRRRLGSG